MKFRNNKGFSLVSVMVAAGLVGGLSIAVMQVMKNIGEGQSRANAAADEADMMVSVRMVLDNPNYCKISLAGEDPVGSPVTFEKKDIDFAGVEINTGSAFTEASEGLDVDLWYSNVAGDSRTLKKFNGAGNPGGNDKSMFGTLNITSMKLVMNNGLGGCSDNYCDGTASDAGQLVIIYEKKISLLKVRKLKKFFNVNIGISTDSSGESTILSCEREREIPPLEQVHDLRHCVSLGKDSPNYGTALCWEKDGSNVVAIKTADGDNPGYGIGTAFRKATHNLSMTIGGCISLGNDGAMYGTALCWEKDGSNVVAIKTGHGDNSDYGIGTNFKKATHNLSITISGCVSLGIDGRSFGTALCSEQDGSNVVAIKTADGDNADYGIGINFRKVTHSLGF